MKAKPLKFEEGSYRECGVESATHVQLRFPGGGASNRILPVILRGSRNKHESVVWSWNGDADKPTLKPSIATKYSEFTEKGSRQYNDWAAHGYPKLPEDFSFDTKEVICHSWVNDGQVIFLNDSTHELAGQTLDLLDVE